MTEAAERSALVGDDESAGQPGSLKERFDKLNGGAKFGVCCGGCCCCFVVFMIILHLWLLFGPLPKFKELCGREADGLEVARRGNWIPANFTDEEYGVGNRSDWKDEFVDHVYHLSITKVDSNMALDEVILVRGLNMHQLVPLADGNWACPAHPTFPLFPVQVGPDLAYGFFWKIVEEDGKEVVRTDHWANGEILDFGGLRYDIWRPNEDFTVFDATGYQGTMSYSQRLERDDIFESAAFSSRLFLPLGCFLLSAMTGRD